MKKLFKTAIAAFFLFGCSSVVQAQISSGYFSAINVQSPVTQVKDERMDFCVQDLLASASVNVKNLQTAPMHTDAVKLCNAMLPGTLSTARITLSGFPFLCYNISLPPAYTFTNGVQLITVHLFVDPPDRSGIFSVQGMQNIAVKANVKVTGKPAGIYINAAVPVTVNYD